MKPRITAEVWLGRCNIKHGQYSYVFPSDLSANSKVEITCPQHGLFLQRLADHVRGSGCPQCGNQILANRKTLEQFLIDCYVVHGDHYDYSNITTYINGKTKVPIICTHHGIFNQIPEAHLSGQGCPRCNNSKGELLVASYLDQHNISYITEHRFSDCRVKRALPFDFFINEYMTVIEYDGIQHFEAVNFRRSGTLINASNVLLETQTRDHIKNMYCTENNIKMIRINYKMTKEEIHSILKKELNL